MSPIILAAIISASVTILVAVIQGLISRKSQKAPNQVNEGPEIFLIGCGFHPLCQHAMTPGSEKELRRLHIEPLFHIEPPSLLPTITSEDLRLSDEYMLRSMWYSLIEASSTSELEQVFLRVEEFLSERPNHAQGVFLRSQVVKALDKELSKQAKIQTYLQLLLYLFVLVPLCLFHRIRNLVINLHRLTCNSIYGSYVGINLCQS